jgi:hypothetical protein
MSHCRRIRRGRDDGSVVVDDLTSPIVGWKSIAWLEALPFRRVALRVPGAKAFNG